MRQIKDLPKEFGMSKFLVVLGLSLAAFANASEVTGSYYTPFIQVVGSTEYYPENLRVFNADGTYEIYTIHDSGRDILKGTYTIEGDTITVFKGNFVVGCPGTVDINDSPMVSTARFSRSSAALSIDFGGEVQTLPIATPEQVKKVMSVPACGDR